jgi:hypothetical protein
MTHPERMGPLRSEVSTSEKVSGFMATGRALGGKVSCDGCFFKQNMLCAVTESGPCATYRPNRPEGLRPPSQLRFNFRQERRLQVAWAFPSASEQVALHA